jgi:hypothetical protein
MAEIMGGIETMEAHADGTLSPRDGQPEIAEVVCDN